MSMIANYLSLTTEQLALLNANPAEVSNFIYSDEVQESEELLDIDKAWHGLHYILTESAWEGEEPLRSVILGGTEIGEDLGYGPARIIDAEKVKEISKALKETSSELLKSRFNLDKMINLGIYGIGSDDDLEWLEDAFEEIAEFYEGAASNDKSVITFMN